MSIGAPRSWYSLAELAAMALPGLPADERSLRSRAVDEEWNGQKAANRAPLARKRRGRGGGFEYHLDILPSAARQALVARFPSLTVANDEAVPDPRWTWYASQAASVKLKAQHRLAIVQAVDASIMGGLTKTNAVSLASLQFGDSERSIFDYLASVAGVPVEDRLPYLAPRHGGGRAQAEVDAVAWQMLMSDYLRPEKPSWEACYRRMVEDYAEPNGITVPSSKALLRRLEKEVPKNVIKKRRGGREDLRRTVPALQRTVADLHALYAVNVDGHTFDVFCYWGKDHKGRDIIRRPTLVGIQDVFSRKLLSWRIAESENTALVRFAFADLFRDYGVPQKAVMDNGKAFASKPMTGGQTTRYRFKIKDSDYNGLLTQLGVDAKWTLPFRGSSKPIERAWRDLCEDISKHPAMSGAYTGNKPDAKPENYRSRAIPIEEFRAHVADRIAKHNARAGRRSEMAMGRSFDQVFAESYALSPVRRVAPEKLHMALLEAKHCRVHPDDGVISLYGNRYWTSDLSNYGGQTVLIRFDPDDLHSQIHVFDQAGRFLCIAPVFAPVGFEDKAGAERRGKLEADVRRATKLAEEKLGLLNADKVAAFYASNATPASIDPPTVVAPVRLRGQTAAARKPVSRVAEQAAQQQFIDHFGAAVERRFRVVE